VTDSVPDVVAPAAIERSERDADVVGPAPPDVGLAELEALLFVAERPLSRQEIASICGLKPDALAALLGDLEVALRGRGVRLVSAGEQVRLVTAPEAGGLIARYVGLDGARLSGAALETLAIVAYRQPVTRGVIERIRGVDSDYVLRGLLHRRLVLEQGRADTPGRPILYVTGFEFMERFGLTSLDDLPPLEATVAARLVEDDAGPQATDDEAPVEPPDDGPGTPGGAAASASGRA
jgi:segregation and condensation protein B